MKLNKDDVWDAHLMFYQMFRSTNKVDDSSFRKFFGITKRQHEAFTHSGTLKVRPATAHKLRAMAKTRNAAPEHRMTLYKAYLAREAKHVV